MSLLQAAQAFRASAHTEGLLILDVAKQDFGWSASLVDRDTDELAGVVFLHDGQPVTVSWL